MKTLQSSYVRVWTIENGARPDRRPRYQGRAVAGRVSMPLGTVAPVYVLDESRYDRREIDDVTQEPRGLADTSLTFLSVLDQSEVLQIARNGCPIDVLLHSGVCGIPGDWEGWHASGKVVVVRNARITSYTLDGIGQFDGSRAATEAIPVAGTEAYEILPLSQRAEEPSGADEIVALTVTNRLPCAGCPPERVVLAAATDQILYFSRDEGNTWIAVSLSVGGAPSDVAVFNGYVVVVSNALGGHAWITLSDLLDESTDIEIVTGTYASPGAPNAMYVSEYEEAIFVAADDLVIYKITDPEEEPEIVSGTGGGFNVTQYISVHGCRSTIVAGAADGGILQISRNGGNSWRTGSVGVDASVETIFCLSEKVWFVGTGGVDSGKILWTLDEGETWQESKFRGSGSGTVRSIRFVDSLIGYATHEDGDDSAYVLRTIDGGHTWHRLPEGRGYRASDRFNSLVALGENLVIAGGVRNGADGDLSVFAP